MLSHKFIFSLGNKRIHRLRESLDIEPYCRERGQMAELVAVDCFWVYLAPEQVFCGKCFPDKQRIQAARIAARAEAWSAQASTLWAKEIHDSELIPPGD